MDLIVIVICCSELFYVIETAQLPNWHRGDFGGVAELASDSVAK